MENLIKIYNKKWTRYAIIASVLVILADAAVFCYLSQVIGWYLLGSLLLFWGIYLYPFEDELISVSNSLPVFQYEDLQLFNDKLKIKDTSYALSEVELVQEGPELTLKLPDREYALNGLSEINKLSLMVKVEKCHA